MPWAMRISGGKTNVDKSNYSNGIMLFEWNERKKITHIYIEKQSQKQQHSNSKNTDQFKWNQHYK